jgi:NAD+ synthase
MVECIAETGGEILLVPNGSPYWRDKRRRPHRRRRARGCARAGCRWSISTSSAARTISSSTAPRSFSTPTPPLIGQLPAFESLVAKDGLGARPRWLALRRGAGPTLPDDDEANYAACVLGLRDYVEKNGFPGVVMGLSGGIDSAICAAMAVDALGPERVHCIMLPYRFTSDESLKDARACADALGVRYDILPIAPAVEGLRPC